MNFNCGPNDLFSQWIAHGNPNKNLSVLLTVNFFAPCKDFVHLFVDCQKLSLDRQSLEHEATEEAEMRGLKLDTISLDYSATALFPLLPPVP